MPPGMATGKVGSQVDLFWLDGTLRISADEQVGPEAALIETIYLSKRSLETVRQIMLIEEDELHRLRGKTGSGIAGDQYIGWFVGYEERNGDVCFFALNIKSSSPEASGSKAREIALQILQDPFYFSAE